jgi:hypothetical protein
MGSFSYAELHRRAPQREDIKLGHYSALRKKLLKREDDHPAGGINSVDLENRLGNIETDCCDRLHG